MELINPPLTAISKTMDISQLPWHFQWIYRLVLNRQLGINMDSDFIVTVGNDGGGKERGMYNLKYWTSIQCPGK